VGDPVVPALLPLLRFMQKAKQYVTGESGLPVDSM
jgi:hypothetical protein